MWRAFQLKSIEPAAILLAAYQIGQNASQIWMSNWSKRTLLWPLQRQPDLLKLLVAARITTIRDKPREHLKMIDLSWSVLLKRMVKRSPKKIDRKVHRERSLTYLTANPASILPRILQTEKCHTLFWCHKNCPRWFIPELLEQQARTVMNLRVLAGKQPQRDYWRLWHSQCRKFTVWNRPRYHWRTRARPVSGREQPGWEVVHRHSIDDTLMHANTHRNKHEDQFF